MNPADTPVPNTPAHGEPPVPEGASFWRPPPFRSAKVQARHLDFLVVPYIRQSTPQQVLEHRESCERQYALADYAVTLGWPRERILIIDEDQGHSGKSAVERTGFLRLLAEVTMGHVGLILGLEMSRLAHCNTDWHHLLEVCAVFGTLLETGRAPSHWTWPPGTRPPSSAGWCDHQSAR